MGAELTNQGAPTADDEPTPDPLAQSLIEPLPAPASADPVADEPDDHPRRIPALDGLRGVAVAGVVLFHAGHLSGGFLGVDLFFVLSGYLITTVLLRAVHPDGSLGLKHFWSRRARRLLPALILMMVIVLPVYAIWFATPTDLAPARQDGIGSLFYVTNWSQIWHGQSYFTATLGESPLRHLWSLAVEEQFYLVWPLILMAAVRRGGTRAVFIVAYVLGTLSALLMIVLGATRAVSFNSLYLGTHTRSAAVLAGAALAAWFAGWGQPTSEAKRRWLQSAAMVAAALLAVLWTGISITSPRLYGGGLTLASLAGVVIVAACVTSTSGPLIRVLSLAPLRALGTISYGVYLWSWPVMVMVSERHTSLSGWTLLLVQLVIIIDLALASWYLVERPILRGAPHPPWSGRLLVVGATAAALAVVGATAGSIGAPSTRVSTEGYAVSSVAGAPKLLVVGDSLPGRLAQEGIIPQRDLLGVSTVDRSVPGCILLRSIGQVKGIEGNIREDVRPCNNDWGALAERYQPDVVLMSFGEFPNDQVDIDGEFQLPCTPAYQREERAALTEAFDQLTATGARVVITTAPGTNVSWVLEGVPAGMNDRVDCMNRLYRDVADDHPNVDVVDLASYVCPPGEPCKEQVDGIDLRPDTVHFRGPSAELVSRWLIPQVLGTDPIDTTTTAPREPVCDEMSALADDLARVVAPGARSLSPAERADVIDQLRDRAPTFAAEAPAVIRGELRATERGWDDLLDRLEALGERPSTPTVNAALGDQETAVRAIIAWSTANCR